MNLLLLGLALLGLGAVVALVLAQRIARLARDDRDFEQALVLLGCSVAFAGALAAAAGS